MICRPCFVISRSSSSSALNPAPDHSRLAGHGRRIVGNSSRDSVPAHPPSHPVCSRSVCSRRSRLCRLGRLHRQKQLPHTLESCSSDPRSAGKSRGVAIPSVTRLVSRSRSRIARELFSNFLARDGARLQLRHRVQPRLDFFAVNLRPQNPCYAADARPFPSPSRRSLAAAWPTRRRPLGRLHQFQISRRHLVEDHRVLLLVIRDAIQMLESRSRRPQCRAAADSSGSRAPIAEVSRK